MREEWNVFIWTHMRAGGKKTVKSNFLFYSNWYLLPQQNGKRASDFHFFLTFDEMRRSFRTFAILVILKFLDVNIYSLTSIYYVLRKASSAFFYAESFLLNNQFFISLFNFFEKFFFFKINWNEESCKFYQKARVISLAFLKACLKSVDKVQHFEASRIPPQTPHFFKAATLHNPVETFLENADDASDEQCMHFRDKNSTPCTHECSQ